MSTSIIDYIFRELAITYLDRKDLAHVLPEDLRGDSLHDEADDPDFDSEEVVSERTLDAKAAEPKPSLAPPRSTHLKPGNGHGSGGTPQPATRDGNGHTNGGNGHGKGNGSGSPAPARAAYAPAAGTREERVRIARPK